MKPQEISKIAQLDPNGLNGTIMQTLLHPKLNEIGYADALYHLLSKTLEERAYYEKMYQRFFDVLSVNNLMTNELLELEEKL